MRNWMSGAPPRRSLHVLETALLGTSLSCCICFPTSAVGWLDVGCLSNAIPGREIQYWGFASALSLPCTTSCDAYQSQPHVSEGSALTHLVHASLFKQRNCLRPFSCQDGTGCGRRYSWRKQQQKEESLQFPWSWKIPATNFAGNT